MTFRETEQAVVVRQQFDWRGQLTAYVTEQNETIPRGNPRFDAIDNRVKEGKCVANPPVFARAIRVVDHHGNVTGHDTHAGFVPTDPDNRLRELLNKAIESGEALEEDLEPSRPEQLSHVVVCVPFDRRIPHLRSAFQVAWRYRSSPHDAWIDLEVELTNIPIAPTDLVVELLREKQLDLTWPQGTSNDPISRGVIEVSFPVAKLKVLFKQERRAGLGWSGDFVADMFERACARDGRSPTDPKTQTLIDLSPHFLHRPAADVANQVLTAINLEFGGPIAGFAREELLQRQMICLGRKMTGGHLLLQFSSSGRAYNEFNLSQQWHDPERHREQSDQNYLPFSMLRNRLTALIDAGYSLEAVALGSGYLEQVAAAMLAGIVRADTAAVDVSLGISFGHNRRLDVLESISKLEPSGYIRDGLVTFVGIARELYEHRNLFVHGLKARDHELTRSVDLTRQALALLKPIVDIHESHRFMDHAHAVMNWSGPDMSQAGVELAISQVQNYASRLTSDPES